MAEIKHGTRSTVVSDDTDTLILVDSQDREIGQLDKRSCHLGNGTLHRAFSIFIFNSRGELLIQQRAGDKFLWPNYWSNSCCSHPRAGEAIAEAAKRRCQQELGLETELTYVYKFEYLAHFNDLGSEHEMCSVYLGSFDGEPAINSTEVQAWRWIGQDELTHALNRPDSDSDGFTPWFKLEWQRLMTEFSGVIRNATENVTR